MKRTVLMVTTVSLMLAGAAMAQSQQKTTLALMDLTCTGISNSEAAILTEALLSELVNTDVFDIVERNKRDEILKELGFTQSGACDETACIIEAGKYLSVQKMVGGSVGKFGQTWSINIRLLNVTTGKVEKACTKYYKGEMDELLSYMGVIAKEIVSVKGQGQGKNEQENSGGEYFDVIYLKDGDIIKGKIVEEASLSAPSAYVKIDNGNGKVLSVLYADILRFDREKAVIKPVVAAQPIATVAPAEQTKRILSQQTSAPIEFRKTHEWVDFEMGLKMGFLLGDDKDLNQLWNQGVPDSNEITWDEKHNSMGMGLDFDLMLRPDDKFSMGPFFAVNFLAPGATGELKWTSTTTYYTKHRLTFTNVVVGGRARALFPIKDPSGAEVANLSLECSVGNLSLAGAGYQTYLDGDLIQEADFSGSSTYVAFGAGVSAYFSRISSINAKFGYQSAGLDEIKFEIIQDDVAPTDEGRTGTVTSVADGSNITVSFKEIFMTIAWSLMF